MDGRFVNYNVHTCKELCTHSECYPNSIIDDTYVPKSTEKSKKYFCLQHFCLLVMLPFRAFRRRSTVLPSHLNVTFIDHTYCFVTMFSTLFRAVFEMKAIKIHYLDSKGNMCHLLQTSHVASGAHYRWSVPLKEYH